MIVRAVLAVLAALALVAAAQPAVEHAQNTRDAATLRASSDEFVDAVRSLTRRSDPGATLADAPRRTLDVAVPAGGTLAIHTEPATLLTRLDGGPAHRRTLPVRVVACGDERSFTGPTTLAYIRTERGPTVIALRGFIREDGTTPSHACAPSTLPERRRGGLPV